MEEGNCANRLQEMSASSPVITEDAPVLEPSERVFDACAALAMTPPRAITHDAVVGADRRNQLRDATVAAIGEDSLVALAQHFDLGGAVVNGIVAISRPLATAMMR